MNLKIAALSVMQRDELKAIVQDYGIEGVDLRSREEMANVLRTAKSVRVDTLLEYLNEQQVKAVCELVGVPATGRRRVLIERLIDARKPVLEGRRVNDGSADEEKAIATPAPQEALPQAPWITVPQANGIPVATITQPELVWPGKYDEHGNRVVNRGVALPFQVVETIKESRASRAVGYTTDLFAAKPSGQDEWRNKLIWGDNLLVMASLLEEFAGKVDLIYIDPPFATGSDFSFTQEIGESGLQIRKEASAIEEKAYRDTWGRGYSSYLQMIHDRIVIARDLLSPCGLFFLHIGPNINHMVRAIADDVFGIDQHRNEIVWKRTYAHSDAKRFGIVHDLILVYSKTDGYRFFKQYRAHSESYIESHYGQVDADGRQYRLVTLSAAGPGPARRFGDRVIEPPPGRHWAWGQERIDEGLKLGKIIFARTGQPNIKQYLDETEGTVVQSVWDDIPPVNPVSPELLGYATQKPESLLQRIIKAGSEEGDIVADFFAGSGTTCAVAEKLNRRWIGCDLGRFAIHTTRKRLLDIPDCKPFEVLNLGQYERKYWQGVNFGDEKPIKRNVAAVAAYASFILDLYHAQPVAGTHVHGKKGAALVHVGAVDAPVTIREVNEAVAEVVALGQKELHVLGWEWEMGLHDPLAQQVQRSHQVKRRLLNIPREVMERQAVDRGDVRFFDLAHLEAEIVPDKHGKRRVRVKVANFVIPDTELIPGEVRAKISKWSDYIDYWAVDWDFRRDTFMNQWQTYRTRANRKLALESDAFEYAEPGRYQVLVKVVDIFGNDTSRLLAWEVR